MKNKLIYPSLLTFVLTVLLSMPLSAQAPPPPPPAVNGPLDPLSWVLLGTAGAAAGKKYYNKKKEESDDNNF